MEGTYDEGNVEDGNVNNIFGKISAVCIVLAVVIGVISKNISWPYLILHTGCGYVPSHMLYVFSQIVIPMTVILLALLAIGFSCCGMIIQ